MFSRGYAQRSKIIEVSNFRVAIIIELGNNALMSDGTKLVRWMKMNSATAEEVCAWLGMSIGTLKKMFKDDPTVDAEYYAAARTLVSGPRPKLERVLAG